MLVRILSLIAWTSELSRRCYRTVAAVAGPHRQASISPVGDPVLSASHLGPSGAGPRKSGLGAVGEGIGLRRGGAFRVRHPDDVGAEDVWMRVQQLSIPWEVFVGPVGGHRAVSGTLGGGPVLSLSGS
nr:hypothetical protein JVH1_4700 [Rhodococcus sp. JVH1]